MVNFQFSSILHCIIYVSLIHHLNNYSMVLKLKLIMNVNKFNIYLNLNEINMYLNRYYIYNYPLNLLVFITYTHMECKTNLRWAQVNDFGGNNNVFNVISILY